ncbi:wax ester/triacylglycerol synthase family O-acyltransferase [Nocardia beijingensis]|uniref:WS/DGAT/MGAT family O-acyltransferase n=1 Tax=Nocardia beijingensis TaxID=95162 RepID=UPI001895C112|nr:wax ester/triacylglycerol synthase family O-acyltransferase [Nocardia beijingensis]MBF6468777.1 wax ester/triacylglycerol synthase family O-acyltransferase [Nocardia beijingensis]
MEFISPVDALFLVAESREHPMHVGSLSIFDPADGTGPEFARRAYATLAADQNFHPMFRKRPARLFGTPQLAWTVDDAVELDYHVQRWALPEPGGLDAVTEVAAGLHSTLLDRHRPLWEAHLIEGLAGGRVGLYAKMHHALIDGVGAQRLLQRTLTTDPESGEALVPWHLPLSTGRREHEPGKHTLGARARALLATAGSAPSALRLARTALLEQQLTLPFAAPRTMFNVPIGGARRCAARSWPLDRIRQVKKMTGTTLNDVVLAMSAGALRAYLLDHVALPDKPLVAMVPVSLRPESDDGASGGNAVAALLCNLATDLADPAARLAAISSSMHRSKEIYRALSPVQAVSLSALTLSPLALSLLLPATVALTSPPFNVVISNIPGPREPQYWNGARVAASYPLSIPFDGQAVNITLTSSADSLDIGIVACRRSVPDVARLLDHLEAALTDLEDTVY